MKLTLAIVPVLILCAFSARAQPAITNAPEAKASSLFKSEEDGWFDVGGFLEHKYGFLPLVFPITEPAVGYGGFGALAFLSKPIADAEAGFGRPNITMVGGLGTENGTWGVMGGDLRHWFDDRVQTMVGMIYASVNLDFYGIGENSYLQDHPLRYNLEPLGGFFRARYRFGNTRLWGGLSYAFASTEVSFDAPPGTPGLPGFQSSSDVGGLTPSLTYDSRDNIFTPVRGTYVELSGGFFSTAFGGDGEFQRASLVAMQFIPLGSRLFLGLRADGTASFGDVPFYLRPYVSLRGTPVLRYQGDQVAQIEAELRWQFWERFSLVGFVGGGAAWNNLEQFDNTQTLLTGGAGFRYELARKYGIHMGVDLAFGPDNTAVYLQVGGAWARP